MRRGVEPPANTTLNRPKSEIELRAISDEAICRRAGDFFIVFENPNI